MFSGLSKQVSSWIDSTKGTTQAEGEQQTPGANLTDPKMENTSGKTSSSSTGSATATAAKKINVLTNVKTQFDGISGWVGSNISKFRKGDNEPAPPTGTGVTSPPTLSATAAAAVASGQQRQKKTTFADVLAEKERERQQVVDSDAVVPTAPPKDDDDNSSATGGADSGPQSLNESPVEEAKDTQFTNVQTKALAGAKQFGNFLFTAVNKAGKTVSEAKAKIKETVEKNNLLSEFTKEQAAFIKTQSGTTASAALPPWVGAANEEDLKAECISLSDDRRNFVRSPPAGVNFQFDYEVSFPVAMAIMRQDPRLEQMRYELVPKIVTEQHFWRNYFYRISLICQANELSLLTGEDSEVKETTSDVAPLEKTDEWERELDEELGDYELVGESGERNPHNVITAQASGDGDGNEKKGNADDLDDAELDENFRKLNTSYETDMKKWRQEVEEFLSDPKNN